MKSGKLKLIVILMVLPVLFHGQDVMKNDTSAKKNGFVADDEVVAMLDSLANLKVFGSGSFLNTKSSVSNNSGQTTEINYFTDSVYRERITNMSMQSPFEYVFNYQVKDFIDLYAYRKRGLTERILGLSQIYFPL